MTIPTTDVLANLVDVTAPDPGSPGARFLRDLYDLWDESLLVDARIISDEHRDILSRALPESAPLIWQAFVDLELYDEDIPRPRFPVRYGWRLTEALPLDSLTQIGARLLDTLEDGALLGEEER